MLEFNKKGGHSNMGICRDITINISEKKNYNTSGSFTKTQHRIWHHKHCSIYIM